MKLVDGLRMYNGDPGNDYITDVCHGLLRYGVLSLKAKIMLLWEPKGKICPRKPLPTHMSTMQPQDEILFTTLIPEQKGGNPKPPAMHQSVPPA